MGFERRYKKSFLSRGKSLNKGTEVGNAGFVVWEWKWFWLVGGVWYMREGRFKGEWER